MAKKNDWWTAPAVALASGRTIMVTGRRDVASFRSNPRFSIRVELRWPYRGDAAGMPTEAEAELMDSALEALREVFDKDPVAVLTGIFTGDDERTMVFYTLSTHIFQRKLNEALAPLPLLPLEISAENDPGWEAYDEMAAAEVTLPEE